MAKYPVELGDNQGQLDAVNYLLSGTQGLGQSVRGTVFSTQALQNGNLVAPFTSSIASLYRTESISTITWLDSNTLKIFFTTPAGVVPYFSLGNPVTITGATPAEYNLDFDSVVETTLTYIVVKYARGVANSGAGSAGTVSLNAGLTDTFKYLHTDCYAQVDIEGGQDRPVISAQIKNTFQYTTTAATILTYTVAINRYKLLSDNNFVFDTTVAYQTYTDSLPIATTSNITYSTVFTPIKDQPLPGSYIYFLDTSYYDVTAQTIIENAVLDYRSLTAQVIKE